jgi:putative DNA methylase
MSNGKQVIIQKDARDFRRFIEESFPVKEVGEASAREKNIRHGHISTLHIWWARRPLAASRATAYAALTPAPKDAEEWQKKRDFIIQLCQWENSNNQSLLERARREILEANGGVSPKVLDPFSGGGSYPLEALRLGCESYANDYNPVAVLIEKATLEYPQKFGRPFEGMPDWAKPQAGNQRVDGKKKKKGKAEQPALFEPTTGSETTDFSPLMNAVRYWSKWVLEEVRKELLEFYPPDPNGNIPVGYIWARTIPCQNPACGEEIPLMRQFWLAQKTNKKIALRISKSGKKLDFKIVGDGYADWPDGFDPDNGTVSQAVAQCPLCNSVIGADTTRKLFREGKSGQKLLVVILKSKTAPGKKYRLATSEDVDVYLSAQKRLETKRAELLLEWGIDPVPDEAIHTPTNDEYISGGILYNFTPILLYGLTKWVIYLIRGKNLR